MSSSESRCWYDSTSASIFSLAAAWTSTGSRSTVFFSTMRHVHGSCNQIGRGTRQSAAATSGSLNPGPPPGLKPRRQHCSVCQLDLPGWTNSTAALGTLITNWLWWVYSEPAPPNALILSQLNPCNQLHPPPSRKLLLLTDSSYFCVSSEALVSNVSSGRASNM